MIKIDEIEQFEKESLPQIKHQYWQLNSQTFPKEMDSFVVALKEKFADVFGKLGDIVQKKDCRVGKITISLIRQSVREGKPRAVIEAFDRTGADKKRLYTDDMDISWLFSTWQTYREMLEKKVKQQMLSHIINQTYITWFMEKEITNLTMVLYHVIRTVLLDADEIDNFEKLVYPECFQISVGEYNDWQNVVFFVPPILKIDEENEFPLIYQRVENLNFGGKVFKNKDLTAAKFVNCGFERCTFDQVSLKEARFVNCRFQNVAMKNGTMENAGFIKCSLVDLDARTMKNKGAYVSECAIENVLMDDPSDEKQGEMEWNYTE